jgi:hypothetical protein
MVGILSSFVYSKGGISAMMRTLFNMWSFQALNSMKLVEGGKEELPKLSMATRSF